MMSVAFGTVLFLAPFLTLFRSGAPRHDFERLTLGSIVWYALSGLVLQGIGLFSTASAIASALIFIVACAVWSFKHHRSTRMHTIVVDWKWGIVGLAAVAVIGYQAWSVHFDYSGFMATINGPVLVEDASIPQPYFSDEWTAAAIVRSITKDGTTAFVDPYRDQAYPQLLAPFYAGLASVFAVTGLDPIAQFGYAPMVSFFLLCVLAYCVARSLGARREYALFVMLLIPYVGNGANLAGIWYLLPSTIAFMVVLIALSWRAAGREGGIRLWETFAALGIAAILYPPYALLLIPALISLRRWNLRSASIAVGIVVAAALVFIAIVAFASGEPLSLAAARFIGYFVRATGLGAGTVVAYQPWIVVPIVAYAGMIAAVPLLWRSHRWYLGAIAAVAAIWALNSVYSETIIMDVQRAVVATAILSVIACAVGFGYLADWVSDTVGALGAGTESKKERSGNAYIVAGIIVALFALLAPWYTVRDSWQSYRAYLPDGSIALPAPPASRYLHEDDLALLAPLEKTAIIVPGLKGLVIGTATDHMPLETKASLVAVRRVPYAKFSDADCAGKLTIMDEAKAGLTYGEQFDCPGFALVGSSREGLFLYQRQR